MQPLILGSQSPRRREILNFFDLPFEQVSSHFDEDLIPFRGNPEDYANQLAKGKVEALIPRFPHSLILTADTIVYQGGKIYGKPQDEQESFQHLKQLVGHWHSVFTGLALRKGSQIFQTIEETRVLFNSLTDEQIRIYHETLPCADKAGGYMIQEAGSLIVRRIDGCYYNVLGLPINGLCRLLQQVDIDLWKHLIPRRCVG
jgi:septum formation protein